MEGVIGGGIIPNTFRGLQDEVEVGEIGEERGTEEIIFPDVAGGPQGNGKVSDSVQVTQLFYNSDVYGWF